MLEDRRELPRHWPSWCVCFIWLILEARIELNIMIFFGFLEELKLRKIASEIFWPLKTPNYLHALTNFWPVKVHVKSLGWNTTHPQVWRNVQIKKLGSISILLTKSVLDMDMKLISCSPDQTTNFDFRIYDFLSPICMTSYLSALEIWVFLNQLYFKLEKKIKFWYKYQFQLENVKNQAQIDKGCLIMAKTIY